MTYKIVGKWLKTVYGDTMFFNAKDIEWLKAGGVPKKNAAGYLILPYGHSTTANNMYPELKG